ncbi:MAG: response regulator [Gammaproteobacteria bacterium]
MAKILAVDDSPSMRKLVSMTLRHGGHEVVTADDGVDALEFAKKESVNLVITDLHMPNMNGISLVKALRNLGHYKYIPLLFLTTETSAEMKREGKNVGATGWIVKPFDSEKLLETIDKVLA